MNHPIDFESIPSNLLEIAKNISITVPEESNISKRIAGFINDGFVFCLLSPSLLSVGTRFKNSLNENAKVHCISESVLEASQNEIVPFTFDNNNPFPPKVLLVKCERDIPVVYRRFEKIQNFFTQLGQPLMEIKAYSAASLINAIMARSIFLTILQYI